MPRFVTSQKQVTQNILTLYSYGKRGSKTEKKFHDGLIRNGRLFTVGSSEAKFTFAPSRFAGYLANTQLAHEKRYVNDGRLTNPVLDKLFGKPVDETSVNTLLYRSIDTAFMEYCGRYKITPANIPNPRKYWISEEARILYDKTLLPRKDDAIDDLGSDRPETHSYFGARYSRNVAIRRKVMERAKGICEYCKKHVFDTESGESYLECHHIIALANDGADLMTNVIALCPNDHREAHYGRRRRELEIGMIKIIKKLSSA